MPVHQSQKSFTQKMNADQEGLDPAQRFDLVLPEKTVNKIMGPDPVPTIDIEVNEI